MNTDIELSVVLRMVGEKHWPWLRLVYLEDDIQCILPRWSNPYAEDRPQKEMAAAVRTYATLTGLETVILCAKWTYDIGDINPWLPSCSYRARLRDASPEDMVRYLVRRSPVINSLVRINQRASCHLVIARFEPILN
jgi:hypothetical protein